MKLNVQVLGNPDRHIAHFRAIWFGGTDMYCSGTIVEGVLAPGRPVNELVADHEVARLCLGLQAACGARPDDPRHASF